MLAMLGFLVTAYAGAWAVDFDLLHPLVSINAIFALYSVSMPILVLLRFLDDPGNLVDVISAEWVALSAFSVPVMIGSTSARTRRLRPSSLGTVAIGLLCCSLGLVTVHLWSVLGAGISEKGEKTLLGSALVQMDFPYLLAATALPVIIWDRYAKRRSFPTVLILVCASFGLAGLLISGERSALFRLLVVALLADHVTFRHVGLRQAAVLALPLIIMSTIAGELKMSVQRTERPTVELPSTLAEFTRSALGSEFVTASFNLSTVLSEVPDTIPYFSGSGFVADLRRATQSGFLMGSAVAETTAAWFTRVFYPDEYRRGNGVGFSLVGAGYLNFGYVGIVGLFLTYGTVVRLIYGWSGRSETGLLVYIAMLPIFLQAPRGDTSVLVSQPFKHVALPMLAMFAIAKLLDHQQGVNKPPPRGRREGWTDFVDPDRNDAGGLAVGASKGGTLRGATGR
jgi:oligosaccharide repeat unit polymerase